MTKVYSTYEAKARFSELLRMVRAGKTVTISYRGEPVAELRPLARPAQTLPERLAELEERGVIVPPRSPWKSLKPIANRPVTLRQYLEERHE